MQYRILIFLFILMTLIPEISLAHPGNTDSSGGHTCRTNCEQWGLEYGEYHYHDDFEPTYSQSDYDDGYRRGYDLAYSYTSQCIEDYEWWWEGPQAFGDGYEAGIDDGHDEGLLVCEENQAEEEIYEEEEEVITEDEIEAEEVSNEVSSDEDYDFYEEKKEETNYMPYAIGGVAGVIIAGYFIGKRRKRPND